MISELYQKVLENELGRARYLLLLMIVGTLQILKQAKLEPTLRTSKCSIK
jgi:hypothetical protein